MFTEATGESPAGDHHRPTRRALAALALAALLPLPDIAIAQSIPARELAELSLEELAQTPVTSVFRRAAPLSEAPTSIFVITGEDIRRSGATSLAEVLRIAPNLQVARVSSRGYAISARGFNNAIGNKLLVLIDGRTVYSPLFSGVFWDQQDVVLEDVERIEVISGPGATQWGANAVNGVINVITRGAAATQGTLAVLGGGKTEDGITLRHGGTIGAKAAFRVYAKAFEREETQRADGSSAGDEWKRRQAGFRLDWAAAAGEATVQGDAYDGEGAASVLGTPTFSGHNLLARWNLRIDEASTLRVQAYVDHAERDDIISFRDRMTVYDIEAHYATQWRNHKVVLGGGYREADDETETSLLITFDPARRSLRWSNVFVQDTMQVGERLEATAGVKLERNVYTGWEVLPSARLAWKPTQRHLLWAALSRAVRAPARLDREFFFPGQPPYLINGGPDFQSEIATVAEVGYRATPTAATSVSISAFHNVYDKLRSGQLPPAVVQNRIEGSATGMEAWGSVQATPAWRLSAGFTVLEQRLHAQPGSGDPTGPSALGNDPRHQALLRSAYSLGRNVEVDVAVRHVGKLPNPEVPAYTAFDARIGWQVNRQWELSLTVQNAFDRRHAEFDPAATASQVPRAAFLRLSWNP